MNDPPEKIDNLPTQEMVITQSQVDDPACPEDFEPSIPSETQLEQQSQEMPGKTDLIPPNHYNHEATSAASEEASITNSSLFLLPDKIVQIQTSDTENEILVEDQIPSSSKTPHENDSFIYTPPSVFQLTQDEYCDDNTGTTSSNNMNEESNEDEVDQDKIDLLAFLQGSKKENENLPFCKNRILSLFPDKKAKSLMSQFHVDLQNDHILLYLKSKLKDTVYHSKKMWKVDFCADILLNLWILLNKQHVLYPDFSISGPFQSVQTFLDSCIS